MARIRSVHPSLFTDEAWVSCSPLARILYIALWTDADDQGVFEWKPLQIKMRLLPGDMADIPPLLDELLSVDLISQYDCAGSKYGAIKDFRKFQRPQKPNAIHPLPDDVAIYVRLKKEDTGPVDDQSHTGAVIADQMEDGGDKIVIAVADASASDWPDLKVRGWMNDLSAEIGSGFLDPSKEPGLVQTQGVFLQWQRLGLSWHHDVKPIIAGSMAKQRGPVKSWKYFDAAMRERAEEIQNPKPVGGMNGKRNYTTASERRTADYAEILGGCVAGADDGSVIDG